MAKKVAKKDLDKPPNYRSEYPCCGQSMFEPVKRGALDGKVWWSVYDNKENVKQKEA